MAKRALLKFRNPDSTQDINDRLKGLFNKGVFSGGNVTAVSGVLRIDVGKADSTHTLGFATAGSDGMFVREDSETTRLDVTAGTTNYIVIRQQYISNGDPVVSIESLTQVEFDGDGTGLEVGHLNPNLIVFATVILAPGDTSVDITDISFLERDEVDQLGRLEFRGLVTEEVDLPAGGLQQNREGDFYIVRNGPDSEPALFAWDGLNWFNMTNAGVVLNLLNDHAANQNEDEKHLTDTQAAAMESTTGLGSEAVPAVLPFAIPLTENALNYNQNGGAPDFHTEFDLGETITGGTSSATATVTFDSTPPIGNGVISLKTVSGVFLDGETLVGDGESLSGFMIYSALVLPFVLTETIRGSTSGATAVVVVNDGVSELRVSTVVGAFIDGEPLVRDSDSQPRATLDEFLGVRAFANGTVFANRVVAQQDPKIPTQDENDALAGNSTGASTDLETESPSDTNRFVTSSKVLAAPTEKIFAITPSDIELAEADGPFFVGRPDDAEAVLGTAQQWFNLYSLNEQEDSEYLNSDFQPVKITRIETGPAGGSPSGNELNPQTDGNVDALGFFTANALTSLFVITDNPTTAGGFRVAFGKKTDLASILPQLLMDRGPKGGQIDTRLQQLLLGTPNAQFTSVNFDGSVTPGQVVAWNGSSNLFVAADPDGGLTPIGVRGNSNNIVQEGLFVAASPLFTQNDLLYADKANPGSLTNTPNEWFIGTAIATDQLMVNMNAISLQSSGEVVPPVTFPVGLFSPSLQPGQTVAWIVGPDRFETADPDSPLRIPLGVRGDGNNVIQSSKYTALSGSPFVGGTRYYFGRSSLGQAGQIVTVPNDWPLGVGIDSNTLLVNATNFAIPRNWSTEHDPESGFHTFQFGILAARDAIVDPETGNPLGLKEAGMLFLRTDTTPPRLDYWNGASWEIATSARIDVPSGTKMLFIQDVVPTGWTFDASLNDRVVAITNNLGLGGTLDGTWTISGLTADPHALTIPEMPSHQHNIFGGGGGDENITYKNSQNGPDGSGGDADPGGRPTELSGNSLGHSHTVSSTAAWRPNLVYAIVCTRD